MKDYVCSICGRGFHTPEARNEHTRLRHKKMIISPLKDEQPVQYTRSVIVDTEEE